MVNNIGSKYNFESVIFDLDGIVTKTALVHSRAWKAVFDEYLDSLRSREGKDKNLQEFTGQDYLKYVDGKPRYEGVKSFLESRGINISYGDPGDSPDKESVCGIGNRKNQKFLEILKKDGVEVYPSTIKLIKNLRDAGIKIGVASSSKNCKHVLDSAGIAQLFETRVDGVVSSELGLEGKPEGDIFVTASFNLGASPANSVVVEDAVSGVSAGRNGGFGMVLGVAREENMKGLFENGADVVVKDLSEISIEDIIAWFNRIPAPFFKFWDSSSQIHLKTTGQKSFKDKINPYYTRCSKAAFAEGAKTVLFLDYDGTLTPIVDRPELAVMSEEMRKVLKILCEKVIVAVVSGRMREDVEKLVGIEDIFYAGSHGFDIKGPNFSLVQPKAEKVIPLISKIIGELSEQLRQIEGVIIEDKKLSAAIHYRLAEKSKLPFIEKLVKEIVKENESLRLMRGKKVFEILPAIDWNKGKAIRWIMKALNLSWDKNSIVYIGDDTTDEDAFRVLRSRGMPILVSEEIKTSSADFYLSSPEEVRLLFEKVLSFT
ncbi:MAG: trehalose-phosphatase [Candidatus Omnitrophica bacterium]|nr:trehalose-phosphatase [Candidatus Omnitrophota bacterium]MBD3268923.1 trehalose-phosphatase [Candidatus Omnitrophota bacterium]